MTGNKAAITGDLEKEPPCVRNIRQSGRKMSRAVTACATARFLETMLIQPPVALLPTHSLTSLQSIIFLSGAGEVAPIENA